MTFTTPDLCDRYSDTHHLQIAEPIFRPFGGKSAFSGRVTTLKVFEDNVLLRTVLEEKVENRVLVVDGGGSHRCALLGGNLAKLACDNGWQGIIVYGCIRDSVEINRLPIGIRALHTHPLKSHKKGGGDRDILVTFAGINFRTGYYVYADEDGIVVSENELV
ncbi:ribonuclease E activity regulator RraA [Methylocaldum szegediense]|jgi:regulator of ribonuclease activity A|uniref:4-hydroxy-4-methyl-2-oxoglutarate aldolase n=1 Tax=Methylocaldum szegediense TaxID=73780 RepID=A0ABN8XF65_9GAMM|nr:ribonuclease E activity regulator RraA [Methylocaldum szegediense]CAI8973201.1 putative 4-hydroxy-4-methyl-2-oxoglutarate aldolase [Methylocaldum szegediense]